MKFFLGIHYTSTPVGCTWATPTSVTCQARPGSSSRSYQSNHFSKVPPPMETSNDRTHRKQSLIERILINCRIVFFYNFYFSQSVTRTNFLAPFPCLFRRGRKMKSSLFSLAGPRTKSSFSSFVRPVALSMISFTSRGL